MTVGSDHYLVSANILFLYGESNANESRENITDCAVELLQSTVYNIDSLRDEIPVFYTRRYWLGNMERVILKVQKNVTNILLNAFTKQRKKH